MKRIEIKEMEVLRGGEITQGECIAAAGGIMTGGIIGMFTPIGTLMILGGAALGYACKTLMD